MPFESWFKNKLAKLFESKKQAIYKEFSDKEAELRSELNKVHGVIEDKVAKAKREQADLDDQEQRVLDRKKELLRVNEELKAQIRLIEAKAAPDSVWTEAFSLGFEKAWDMMIPIMMSGVEKVRDEIRSQEIEKSLERINPIVTERITQLGQYQLKPVNDLIMKKNEFSLKKAKATDPLEQQKYDNYISTLDWMLAQRNGN